MAGNENQEHSDKDISAKVLLGAALVGVRGGALTELTNKAEEARSQAAALIEPGDQRHIPHPWENFKNRVQWVYNYVVTPGDMNLNHSPQPAETTMQLHTALVNQTADTQQSQNADAAHDLSGFLNMSHKQQVALVGRMTENYVNTHPGVGRDEAQQVVVHALLNPQQAHTQTNAAELTRS